MKKRDAGTITLGRESFARMSAVEGVRLSPEALDRMRDFDRRGLSAQQRRREIVDAHRPKA